MSLSPETPVLEFVGNGSATTFEHVPHFTLSDASHLTVAVDHEIVTSGFTQTATGIVFDTAPAVGTSIILRRVTPLDQPLTTDGLRNFALENIAAGFDRVIRAVQDRFHTPFNRPLTFPLYEPSDAPTELPDASMRKACVLGFDQDTGEPVLYRLPVPIVPLDPPTTGTWQLTSVDGVLQWTAPGLVGAETQTLSVCVDGSPSTITFYTQPA